MQDDKIIRLFFARSEEAIRQLDCKYGKVCHSLSLNILGDRQDAEECVNDAYLGAWNTIPPQNPPLPCCPTSAKLCATFHSGAFARKRLPDGTPIMTSLYMNWKGVCLLPVHSTISLTQKNWLPLSGSFWTACRWKTG